MAKIRLTKNELKNQKDNLKRFLRYLPTLDLKKKQLIQEIQRIQREADELLRFERSHPGRDFVVAVRHAGEAPEADDNGRHHVEEQYDVLHEIKTIKNSKWVLTAPQPEHLWQEQFYLAKLLLFYSDNCRSR